jgi:cell wall assembly regulator SMI1
MLTMQEIWKRIEEGFETIDASALLEHFQPGAIEAEMREVEVFLGITFPDEVKASYHMHNGSNGQQLVGDPDQHTYQLYSFAEMMSDWQQEMDLQRQIDQRAELNRQESMKLRLQQREDWMDEGDLADAEEEVFFGFDQRVRCNPPDRSWWWHPGWIPLLRSDSGVRLCLDLAPGPAGQVGQMIQLDVDSGNRCPPVIASGWHALLLTFADDLHAGEYRLRENIDGGIFLSFA